MCNNCQNTTCHDCNQQPLCESNDCSCPVKDLSTDCILYTGGDLKCSGIKDKTILTELIQQLDNFICTALGSGIEFLSIGEGEPVYAGVDPTGKQKIRTIKTENSGRKVAEILKDVSYDTQNGLLITAKSLDSDTLTFSDDGDNINIEVPGSATVKTFYVDPYYYGSIETGSRAKPYRTLKKAIDAFIDAPNGGTILAPIYGYTGVIELLNDVNVFSDLPYISVNRLKIEGNGFMISYYGTQDYFISTAYLVGLDPKSVSGKLDYSIRMEFNNLRIQTAYTNKFVHNLSYTSPTFSGFQNTSGMSFTKCTFTDSTWQIGNSSAYINTGQTHFGSPVYAQNTIPGDAYMIKSENVAWFNDGTFTFNDCKVYPTTSSALYFKNTTGGALNLLVDYNPNRRNYSTFNGVDYLNSDTVCNIIVDNDYPTNPIGRSSSWIRVRNFEQTSHPANAGGQNAIFKTLGDSTLLVQGGEFYLEFPRNLVQIDKATGIVELTNVNASAVYSRDTTYGSYKYTGSTPLTTQKYVWSDQSSLILIKQGLPSTDYLLPSANSATVNGAMYNTLSSYPNNIAAIAGGLISNCIYFNTTSNSLTKIP